jgi:dTDP-4-amino-4,6-dideoxygalactose transaminase
MKKIEFFKHSIAESDIKRADKVLRSIFLTTGKEVEEFEENFSRYIGKQHTVGLTSCTGALHLSLISLGIGEGDEVITTPMSFCASANSIIQAGARPVFVDVEEETGNINADLIESAVTEKTRAILPVHVYGQMCDMRKINEIADKNNLYVIEDAAHAIEAERDGIRVGELSDTVCFSFYATKNITSGEGGAVSTDKEELSETFKMLRLHGINKDAANRYTKYYDHWDMPILGWKYNMDNIQAALLIGQLERIESLWKRRDRLWKRYEEGLRSTKGITLLQTIPSSRHGRHIFTILVPPDRRDLLLHSLQQQGVGIAVNFRPIHLLEYYRKTFGHKEGDYPVAEFIGNSTISLPLYPALLEAEADFVMDVLKDKFKGLLQGKEA